MSATIAEQRKELANMLLTTINTDGAKWQDGILHFNFQNLSTKQGYHGSNWVRLFCSTLINNYHDPRWATFNQARNMGLSIKKGSTGTRIMVHKTIDRRTNKPVDNKKLDAELAGMSAKEEREFRKKNLYSMSKYHCVFNGSQIEGLEKYNPVAMTEDEMKKRNDNIEQIITQSEAPIYYDGNGKNFYLSTMDEIHLTNREKFYALDNFYTTALHEMAHSTGHKSRLHRDMDNAFGSEPYAREELVAELASVMIATELGLQPSIKSLTNNAVYVREWSKQIKSDDDFALEAISAASLATDFICNKERRKQLISNAQHRQQSDEKPNNDKNEKRGIYISPTIERPLHNKKKPTTKTTAPKKSNDDCK